MDYDGKYWATFWAIAGTTLSIIVICVTINASQGHRERMAMIEKGMAPPPTMSEDEYQLARERIDHGCLPPEIKAPEQQR